MAPLLPTPLPLSPHVDQNTKCRNCPGLSYWNSKYEKERPLGFPSDPQTLGAYIGVKAWTLISIPASISPPSLMTLSEEKASLFYAAQHDCLHRPGEGMARGWGCFLYPNPPSPPPLHLGDLTEQHRKVKSFWQWSPALLCHGNGFSRSWQVLLACALKRSTKVFFLP